MGLGIGSIIFALVGVGCRISESESRNSFYFFFLSSQLSSNFQFQPSSNSKLVKTQSLWKRKYDDVSIFQVFWFGWLTFI